MDSRERRRQEEGEGKESGDLCDCSGDAVYEADDGRVSESCRDKMNFLIK